MKPNNGLCLCLCGRASVTLPHVRFCEIPPQRRSATGAAEYNNITCEVSLEVTLLRERERVFHSWFSLAAGDPG